LQTFERLLNSRKIDARSFSKGSGLRALIEPILKLPALLALGMSGRSRWPRSVDSRVQGFFSRCPLHLPGASGLRTGSPQSSRTFRGCLCVSGRSFGRSAARFWGLPVRTIIELTANLGRLTGRIGWMYARRLVDAQAGFVEVVERFGQAAHDHLLRLVSVKIHNSQTGFGGQLELCLTKQGTFPEDAGRCADDAFNIEQPRVAVLVREQRSRMPDYVAGAGAGDLGRHRVGRAGLRPEIEANFEWEMTGRPYYRCHLSLSEDLPP
jgi:hypothetical protein